MSASGGCAAEVVERRAGTRRAAAARDGGLQRARAARWPSVWPSGISRTPAETRLATKAAGRPAAPARAATPWPPPRRADGNGIGERRVPQRLAAMAIACARAMVARSRRAKARALRGRSPGARSRDGAQRERRARHLSERGQSSARRRAPGVGEQDRVAAAGAVPQATSSSQATSVARRRTPPASTAHSRPWRIGEGADREGRRQPRHQAMACQQRQARRLRRSWRDHDAAVGSCAMPCHVPTSSPW